MRQRQLTVPEALDLKRLQEMEAELFKHMYADLAMENRALKI